MTTMGPRIPTLAALVLGATLSTLSLVGRATAQPASTDLPPTAVPVPAAEATPSLSFSSDVTAASRYIFQGFDYSEGRAVLQPNASLVFRSVTANVWGNYHVDHGEFDEFDLSLKMGRSFGSMSVAAGYMNLQYPNRVGWDPSQELFVELGMNAPLSPKLSIHYDFDAGTGTYSTLGLSKDVGHSFSLATNLFYQGGYYDMTGVPAAELKASWAHTTGAYTFAPAISYFATWSNGDFRDAGAVPSNWLFALDVARAF